MQETNTHVNHYENRSKKTKMEGVKRFLTTKGDQRKKFRLQQAYYSCLCFRRMFKLKAAEPPQDIVELFQSYSDNKEVMTMENLMEFLTEVQGENKNEAPESARKIFDSLKHLHVFQRRGLHLDAFFKYLIGDYNPPLAPPRVHHDMEKPLSHYYLYTGHNSYLTGNQLSSTSSIEPIVKALKNGVRVIELDLWPCKKNHNEIEVRHGRTMTSSVELIKCLEAIRDNAFSGVSQYPVIITFEDHLDSSLQAKVAQMVKNIFGEMLQPGIQYLDKFPSPEDLKGKILISTKPPLESPDSFSEHEHLEQKDKDQTDELVQIQIKDNEEEEDDEAAVPEYKLLIAIHAIKWGRGLINLLRDHTRGVARLSMSEEKLKDAVNDYATDIVRFTQRNLLRVYPKGTRFLSSNYNPMIGWTHGAQMVAFNMQGYGKHLWTMQGMFRANGGCGYVKKPDFLLSDAAFDPNRQRPVKKTLKVKVYMGTGWHLDFDRTDFDPFSPPDFFTKIEMLGVPADIKKEMTMPIEDQWEPVWNHEFVFELTAPELALLRVEVREFDTDRRHDFAGQTCLPVSELRSGIRAVPLHDKRGEKYNDVRLLMRFQILQ